jgi:hypothetical protein
MISLEAIAQAFNAFFHAPQSASTIGLVRIVFGILFLLHMLLGTWEAQKLLGPDGYLGMEEWNRVYKKTRFTLFRFLPQTKSAVWIVLAIGIVGSVGVTLGFCSRLSCALVFIAMVSIHQRMPLSFNAGDGLLRIMAFLLIFSRAGDAYSLDALLGRSSGPAMGSPWCERVMQIQMSIIYLRTVYWKVRDVSWRDGTAAYWPHFMLSYKRFSAPPFLVRRPFVRLMTWTTLVVESSVAVSLWVKDFRLGAIAVGLMLHLGLEYLLNIQLFGWAMMCGLLLFVDPSQLDVLLHHVR